MSEEESNIERIKAGKSIFKEACKITALCLLDEFMV